MKVELGLLCCQLPNKPGAVSSILKLTARKQTLKNSPSVELYGLHGLPLMYFYHY